MLRVFNRFTSSDVSSAALWRGRCGTLEVVSFGSNKTSVTADKVLGRRRYRMLARRENLIHWPLLSQVIV